MLASFPLGLQSAIRSAPRRMWCSTCQQDVPGLGSPSSGGDLRCGKCGGSLSAANQEGVRAGGDSAAPLPTMAGAARHDASWSRLLSDGPLADDDWALEAELRGVERLVGAL